MMCVLTGANAFAIHQELAALIADFTGRHGAYGVERIDGETLDPARLPELLQGGSLFATGRLVVLRDSAKNKLLWEVLGEWAGRMPPEVELIVVEPQPDKRTRTYKQLQKHATMREFADLGESELAAWAAKTAAGLGANLDAKTANYLVQRTGTDQWRLYGEVQKLSALESGITTTAIDELVEPTAQASAFELLDSLLAGKGEQARRLLARLKTFEDPYKLFGLLVSQIHTLALVVAAAGKSADTIAKEAGIHPFVVRKMQSHARQINMARLHAIIDAVAACDTQLKSTGMEPWVLVEQCLAKIVK